MLKKGMLNWTDSYLLVCAAVLLLGLGFVAGVVFGVTYSTDYQLAPDSVTNWISALATVAVCFLTIVLAIETWRLRSAQTLQIHNLQKEGMKPLPFISLEPSFASHHFFNVVIRNNGQGYAKDISFSFFDRNMLPVDGSQCPLVNAFLKLGVFSNGLKTFGVGQVYSSFLLSFLNSRREGFVGDIFDYQCQIKVDYKDAEDNPYTDWIVIDLSEYRGKVQIGGSHPTYQIAKHMEELVKLIKHSSNGQSRLGVDVYDATDRDIERKEREEWIAQNLTDTET